MTPSSARILCRVTGALLALSLATAARASTPSPPSPAPKRQGEPDVVTLTNYRDIAEADLCALKKHPHFTGTLELRHADGTLIRRLACGDGRKNGIDRQFYLDGTLRMERNWKTGALDGLYRRWSQDGVLIEQWTYGPLGLEGGYYIFHPNGTQAAFAHYTNGKRNGAYADFDKNGKLDESGHYVDDRADGEIVERTMYGGLAYRHFDKGRRVGEQSLWSAKGKLLRLERYTPEGQFLDARTWNTQGELIRQYTPITLPKYGPGLKMVERKGGAIHITIESGTNDPARLALLHYSNTPGLYKLETTTCHGTLIERVEAYDHKLLSKPVHNGKVWECPSP